MAFAGRALNEEQAGVAMAYSALAAKQLGGSLIAHSEGLKEGAYFTLELPVTQPAAAT